MKSAAINGNAEQWPLIEKLFRAASEASRIFEGHLEAIGKSITARQALAILCLDGQTLTQRQLHDITGMDRSSLSFMLVGMEEQGKIVRSPKDNDARAFEVRLTPATKKLVPAIRVAYDKTRADLLKRAEKAPRGAKSTVIEVLAAISELPA
jgi:DNA-binding MarR family transcriptional regulator